eukprot:s105_g28.t1
MGCPVIVPSIDTTNRSSIRQEPNVITLGASAAACARSRQWPQACGLLGCCSAAQLEINVILESTAINALAKEQRWSDSLLTLQQLSVSQLEIRDFGAPKKLGSPSSMLFLMAKSMVSPESFEAIWPRFNAVQPQESWASGLSFLTQMRQLAVCCDLVSINAAISACSQDGGQWQFSSVLLMEIQEKELQPSEVTFGSLVKCCEVSQGWQQALQLLTRMARESRNGGWSKRTNMGDIIGISWG